MDWKEALEQSESQVIQLDDAYIYTTDDSSTYALRTPHLWSMECTPEEIEKRLTRENIPLEGWS